MLTYNDLYEFVRKEKYGDQLQALPKDFVQQVAEYFAERRQTLSQEVDSFSEEVLRAKKQFENSRALFNELILRRKRKILNLVFVAAETGILKKDFTTLLDFEQGLFEDLIKAVESGDKRLQSLMQGKKEEKGTDKMIIIKEDVEQIVDMQGRLVGPYKKGDLVHLDLQVADILVSVGKATFIDS